MNSIKTLSAYLRHYFRTSFVGSAISFHRFLEKNKKVYEKEYLNLKNLGYHIIEDYISESSARDLNEKFKQSLAKYSSHINEKDDQRLFGVEHCLNGAKSLYDDKKISTISLLVNKERTHCGFTLGGFLKSGQNGSSGGGWHRDSFLSQFKAMLYLTDVNSENGPFQLLPGSHKLRNVMRAIHKGGLRHWQDRLCDKEVEKVEGTLGIKRKTFTGKAGTLILFNSTCIHRGKPIETGERSALTNYYFPIGRNISDLRKQFKPMLTVEDIF
jgi:hypothetical protein